MKYKGWLRRLRTYIFIVLLITLALAGLYFVSSNIPEDKKIEILLEVGKVLLQIIALLTFAGVTSSLIKSFEKDRKANKALHDFRSEILDELQALYQGIKKSRHVLRSVGLTSTFDTPIAMSSPQIKVYGEELDKLHEAKLNLEKIKLKVSRFKKPFTDTPNLESNIDKMDAYLQRLLSEHERLWPKLKPDGSPVSFSEFKALTDFTGLEDKGDFKNEFSDTYDNAVSLVRNDLLPLDLALQNGTKDSSESLVKKAE